MTLEQYKNKYPCLKALKIMSENVGKRKDLLIWRLPYFKWELEHFQDVWRIDNGLEPLCLIVPNNTMFSSKYTYFIDGQESDLNEIAFELGIQPQSVINSLGKNFDKILRKGLTITRVLKNEQ